jgi:hypothetical protein
LVSASPLLNWNPSPIFGKGQLFRLPDPKIVPMHGQYLETIQKFAVGLHEYVHSKPFEASIMQASKDGSKLLASVAHLKLFNLEHFLEQKQKVLFILPHLLEACRNFFIYLFHIQSVNRGIDGNPAPESVSFAITMTKLSETFDFLKTLAERLQATELSQDKALKDQLSKDGRQLKSLGSQRRI